RPGRREHAVGEGGELLGGVLDRARATVAVVERVDAVAGAREPQRHRLPQVGPVAEGAVDDDDRRGVGGGRPARPVVGAGRVVRRGEVRVGSLGGGGERGQREGGDGRGEGGEE